MKNKKPPLFVFDRLAIDSFYCWDGNNRVFVSYKKVFLWLFIRTEFEEE